VIGRITASGAQASRVLLLTDLNSRVPVRVEGTRQRAVLAGDNTDRPRLAFLPATAKLHPGDRLVTSGDGGLFPAGLPVGVVETVGPDGVRVRPWSDLESMEFIRVVRYDARSLALDGIENEGPGTVRRLAPKAPVTAAQAADAEAAAAARAQPPAAPAAQTAPSAEAPAAADPDPASDRPE
jgi:rod shape-determining protein MreC